MAVMEKSIVGKRRERGGSRLAAKHTILLSAHRVELLELAANTVLLSAELRGGNADR